jgi:hypothetical protein
MYYTVYKVTNKVNGKVYIGTHKTRNLDDGYMGSGKYLKRAINKHGIEHFEKEILFIFDNPEEMFEKEAELVNEDFLAEENTYNLRVGGFGGFDYINTKGLTSGTTYRASNLTKKDRSKGATGFWNRFYLDEAFQEKYRAERRELAKNIPNFIGYFKGKSHTEESKAKIGKANSKHQTGKNNSQYGTCWITHPIQKRNKKIKNKELREYLKRGWKKGRKMYEKRK